MVEGNPRALNDTKIKKICNLIRCGNYVKTSVKACDVNYNTFLSSMKKGKNGVAPYDESAENGNVGADMWKLGRMFPNRWGQSKRIEAKVDNSQDITIRKYSDVNKKEE